MTGVQTCALPIFEAAAPGLGESSSVLRLGRAANEDRAAFELLREGLHDLAALRRTAGMQLLFVCTGNICRSPLAEGMARRAIASRLGCKDQEVHEFGFKVSSAGTFASPGCPASQYSIDQLEQRDIDLSAHGASPTSSQTLAGYDRIYCLAHSHLDAVRQLLPKRLKSNALLLDPDGADVPDPIGGSSAEYARCAKQIEEFITARLDEWA